MLAPETLKPQPACQEDHDGQDHVALVSPARREGPSQRRLGRPPGGQGCQRHDPRNGSPGGSGQGRLGVRRKRMTGEAKRSLEIRVAKRCAESCSGGKRGLSSWAAPVFSKLRQSPSSHHILASARRLGREEPRVSSGLVLHLRAHTSSSLVPIATEDRSSHPRHCCHSLWNAFPVYIFDQLTMSDELSPNIKQ